MMPDPVLLFAMVIVLLPMGYCLLAAPAFLLVRLDIPPVTQLLRGLFNAYFLLLAIAGVIGMVAFAVEGRLVAVVGLGLIAAFAVVARRKAAAMPQGAPLLIVDDVLVALNDLARAARALRLPPVQY